MPTSPSDKLNDWIEYKRLVLAELERINDCIEKLQDGHVDVATQIHKCQTDKKEIMKEIAKVHEEFQKLQKEVTDHHPATIPEGRWKFYAAIATVIGSAIVSIISLITAMLSK